MTVLKLHAEPMREEWRDAYGHLNEAYYLVPFSNANWAMQEYFGIGVPYFERTGCALYTVESHIRYLREVRGPAELQVETVVVGFDVKRLWCAHSLVVEGTVRATGEFMGLHYHPEEKRTVSMPEATLHALEKAQVKVMPKWVGGQVGFERG